MSRRWAGVLVAGAALVLVVTVLVLRAPSRPQPSPLAPAPTLAPEASEPESAPPSESRRVTLWLPAAAGRIAPLEAEVTSAPDPKSRIEALLRALLAASPQPPFAALFDRPVELAAAIRGPNATLFVDLHARDGEAPPGSGSTLELQRVYSIVHTVARNEPSVERVVLLWNGVQRRSFAGHVDTGRPLEPRPELEARANAERAEPPPDAARGESPPP